MLFDFLHSRTAMICDIRGDYFNLYFTLSGFPENGLLLIPTDVRPVADNMNYLVVIHIDI